MSVNPNATVFQGSLLWMPWARGLVDFYQGFQVMTQWDRGTFLQKLDYSPDFLFPTGVMT